MSLSVPGFYTDLDPGLPFDAFLLGKTLVSQAEMPYQVQIGVTKTYIEVNVLSANSVLNLPPDTDPKLFDGLQYLIARYGSPADPFALAVQPLFSNDGSQALYTREVMLVQWDSPGLRWVPVMKSYLTDEAVKDAVERAIFGTLIVGAVGLAINTNQSIDLATSVRSYRTGSDWTGSFTLTFTGVPKLKSSFWVFNESGHTQNLTGALSLGSDPYQLANGAALLLTEIGGVLVKLAETGIAGSVPDGSITTGKLVDGSVTDVKLSDTGVVPGAYTAANITVNAKGRLTLATSGTAPAIGDGTITNAKLLDMPQATFKGRAAGVGTGVPQDLTAAQAKTALAIVPADITGNIPGANIADASVTNLKLASMPNLTIKANVTGAPGAPQDVDGASFATNFGLGNLAFKSQITGADVSAAGTRSAATYWRGDDTWAGVIPDVAYDIVTLGDGATLNATHSRYQISSSVLMITQVELLNSTPANPVRLIMEDDESVTPRGAEFDIVQADTQTGLCVLRPELNGTINGVSFAVNAVASCALTLASGANVDISNIPAAAIAGSTFEMRDHSVAGNNGFYRRTAIGTTCTKLSGINPVNAAAEAVNIDTGFVALSPGRATAVLIVTANPGATPVARLEGETWESRDVRGDTNFRETLQVTGFLDVDALSDFSFPMTLSGTAKIIGGGKVAEDLELKDCAETWFDAGNKSGAVTFDYRDGLSQKCVVTGNWTSLTVTNWPATGRVGRLEIEAVQDATGGRLAAFGASYRFPGGTDFTFSTAASARDKMVLTSRDAGTIVDVSDGGKAWAA